jgi:hypothetical protein
LSSCHHVDEDIDAKVVALIFNGAIIEKTITPFPFTIARERRR